MSLQGGKGMKCRICGRMSKKIFSTKLLYKYDANYYYCEKCGFLQTEEPFWLKEAYSNALTCYDTGVLERNMYFMKALTVFIYKYLDVKGKYLDYAGGYGILTRLMRDRGFDFYWNDKYAENMLAKGFEWDGKSKIEAITSFESFEHFVNPIEEIENLLKISRTIIFSTDVLPEEKIPAPNEWWYYALEGGQHIAFYSHKTFIYIAEKYNLNYYCILGMHILTDKKVKRLKCGKLMQKISDKWNLLYTYTRVCHKLKVNKKTMSDMTLLLKKNREVENNI